MISFPEEELSRHHDLDDLAGSWDGEESLAFEEALRDQRTVDPDLWV